MTNFKDLGLGEKVLQAVEAAGYTTPTPIQAEAIPMVLANRDVLGIAQTGTGKTASFTLPMIDILSSGRARARMPRSLILEPTRELAAQVADNFTAYGKYTKLTMALLIGGVSFTEQDRNLQRGVDVLIATPGRLLDHFSRGKLLLNGVQILVIDEADRMLDMGFIPDVEKICSLLSRNQQTLFFSATMPSEIRRLASAFLKDPVTIQVAPPASTVETVLQKVVHTDKRQKSKTLERLIRQEKVSNGIIFCNRKKGVDEVFRTLKAAGFNAAPLHGDMPQSRRLEVLDQFRNGEIMLLVASDVAARGLDIREVSHVFNYDVPHHAEDYVHRIGRTARAGRKGHAISLVLPDDKKAISAIEKLINQEIPELRVGTGDSGQPDKPSSTPAPSETAKPASTKQSANSGQRRTTKAKTPNKTSKPSTAAKLTEPLKPESWGDHIPQFLAHPSSGSRKKSARA